MLRSTTLASATVGLVATCLIKACRKTCHWQEATTTMSPPTTTKTKGLATTTTTKATATTARTMPMGGHDDDDAVDDADVREVQ